MGLLSRSPVGGIAIPCVLPIGTAIRQHKWLVHICATTIHRISSDPLSCFLEPPAESLLRSKAGAGSSEAEESHLLSDTARQFSVAVICNTVTSMKSRCPQIHYSITSSIKETVLFPVTAWFHLLLRLRQHQLCNTGIPTVESYKALPAPP